MIKLLKNKTSDHLTSERLASKHKTSKCQTSKHQNFKPSKHLSIYLHNYKAIIRTATQFSYL